MSHLADYAKHQRRVRSLQPRVSSEEAHAQARRVLAAISQPAKKSSKTGNSSGGRDGMAG